MEIWKYGNMERKKGLLTLLFYYFIILLILAGCAKRQPEIQIVQKKPARRKQQVLLVSSIHHTFTEQFNKKILSKWWDLLVSIKKNYSKTPFVINISGPVVKRLKNSPQLNQLITLKPEDLNLTQVMYLKKKYGICKSADSILSGQIKESLSYLGDNLSKDSFILNLVEKSTYTVEDKNKLVDFLKTKIKDFDQLLKSVLDMENIDEATTSLSNAHIGILDKERIKVQILESMVNYKMWRQKFPDGFIPKAGYLNSEAVEQLKKTNIKWVTVNSKETEDYIRTSPQVLYVDDYFCNLYSSSTLCAHLNNLAKKNEPHVLIADFDDIDLLLQDKYLNFIGYDEFIKVLFGRTTDDDLVKLSTSTFKLPSIDFSAGLNKIKTFLKESCEVIYKYKNSGRASLDIWMDIQNKLLVAEAGEICDNLDNSQYDRIFRKSLIEIYRKIGISPPVDLFVSVTRVNPYQVDKEMTSLVKVNCDGKISPGEWEGALKVNIDGENISRMYCGFDENNIYYMLKISTHEVNTAGVYIGHMNVARAALYPRNYTDTTNNIQDYPIYLDIIWRKDVPSKTIIYRTTGNEAWEPLTGNYEVGYSTGILEFSLPFKYLDVRPGKKIFYKIYTDKNIHPENNYIAVTACDFELSRGIISYIDPVSDIYGPGDYQYPEKLKEFIGNLDLRKIEVDEKYDERIITIELSTIDNPYLASLGFSLPIIDIYIDINHGPGLGRTSLLEGRKAYTASSDAWEYCISINGWEKAVYNTVDTKIGEPEISVSPVDKTINIFVPRELITASIDNWGIIPIIMASDAHGKLIKVASDTGDNSEEFRGRKIASDTNIIDVILPPGYRQKDILGANRSGRAIEIPALRKQ